MTNIDEEISLDLQLIKNLSSDANTKLDILMKAMFPNIDTLKYKYSYEYTSNPDTISYDIRYTLHTLMITVGSISHKPGYTNKILFLIDISYCVPYNDIIERKNISMKIIDYKFEPFSRISNIIERQDNINNLLLKIKEVDDTILYDLHNANDILTKTKQRYINTIEGI